MKQCFWKTAKLDRFFCILMISSENTKKFHPFPQYGLKTSLSQTVCITKKDRSVIKCSMSCDTAHDIDAVLHL